MSAIDAALLTIVCGGQAAPVPADPMQQKLLECWGRADRGTYATEQARHDERAKCLNTYFDNFWVSRKRE